MRSRVRILAVTHVLPAPDHQTAIWSPEAVSDDGHVKLSFMDALFVDRVPMQRLFFYEGPDVPPFQSLVRSLKSSLAAVLPIFQPLAGKLTHCASTGDVVVDCSPAAVSPGVRFVEAEYAGSIDDMGRLAVGDEHHTEALTLLGPELNAGRLPAPVLAVQVTRPAIGAGLAGVVVGVSIHHAVADGHSVWQFMRAWSAASRRDPASDMVTPPPTWDRTAIPYPKAEEVARKFLRTVAPALPVARSPSLYTPLEQRRRSFLLRADDIRSLKQSILTKSQAIGGHLGTFPSTYVAVLSLVWTSIVRAKSLNDPDGGDAYFLVPVDLRRRLGPAPAAHVVTFTGSSNRFMAYETDFGWGAPSRVELVSLFTRELVLLLGAEDGGVQVTVALDHAHMEGFAANFMQVSRRGDEGAKN
uniref:Uncharacterized protein n=1 Tax=Saccharum hybrid cultivar R570 TaxID=131158 RepID=A0A059Q2Z4_9POAL|nr:hypothetical protein SHCRBa_013_P09_F_240 [Saccharum hybrid cultivar R570]